MKKAFTLDNIRDFIKKLNKSKIPLTKIKKTLNFDENSCISLKKNKINSDKKKDL